MRKKMSLKQIEANRRNAQKSTGPRTAQGKAVSKRNALKHGILSKQVLVRGRNLRENPREFARLHQEFCDDLQPVGPVEAMLVDQIVTAHWRRMRALTAEAGEIELSVDGGQWQRRCTGSQLTSMLWGTTGDPLYDMRNSAMGNRLMESELKAVRASVEKEGELTEAAIQGVIVHGKPYRLTRDLEELRLRLQQNPEGLDAAELRAKQKEQALAFLDRQLRLLSWSKSDCEEREKREEESRQAAAVLPDPGTLDKILRYETKLERQMYRAMAQLERIQRMRQGEVLPAPLTVEVSERA